MYLYQELVSFSSLPHSSHLLRIFTLILYTLSHHPHSDIYNPFNFTQLLLQENERSSEWHQIEEGGRPHLDLILAKYHVL